MKDSSGDDALPGGDLETIPVIVSRVIVVNPAVDLAVVEVEIESISNVEGRDVSTDFPGHDSSGQQHFDSIEQILARDVFIDVAINLGIRGIDQESEATIGKRAVVEDITDQSGRGRNRQLKSTANIPNREVTGDVSFKSSTRCQVKEETGSTIGDRFILTDDADENAVVVRELESFAKVRSFGVLLDRHLDGSRNFRASRLVGPADVA